MIPIVHFQRMPDEGRLARELFEYGKPFAASIVPALLDRTLTITTEDQSLKIYTRRIIIIPKKQLIYL